MMPFLKITPESAKRMFWKRWLDKMVSTPNFLHRPDQYYLTFFGIRFDV